MSAKYYIPCFYACDEYIDGKIGGVFSSEKPAVDMLIDILIDQCRIQDMWTLDEDEQESFIHEYSDEEKSEFRIKLRNHCQDYKTLLDYVECYNDTRFQDHESIYSWNMDLKCFDLNVEYTDGLRHPTESDIYDRSDCSD